MPWKIRVVMIWFFVTAISFSSYANRDSLLRVLKAGKTEEKLAAYPALAFLLQRSNPDSAIKIAQQGIAFADSQKNIFHKASCLNMAGLAYNHLGRYNKALESYQNSLRLFESIKELDQAARVNDNISQHYYMRKDFRTSQQYLLKALRYFEAQKDSFRIARSYQTLSIINREIKQYDKSREYLNKSIQIFKKQNKENELATAYSLMGNLFIALKQYEAARPWHLNGLLLYTKTNDLYNQAISHENIAGVDENLKQFAAAYKSYSSALEIFRGINSPADIAYEQMRMSISLAHIEKPESGLLLLDSAELVFKKDSLYSFLSEAYLNRSLIYEIAGDNKQSLAFYKKHIALRDSLTEAQKTEEIQRLQTEYETDRKEQQIALLKAETLANENQISRRNWLIVSLVFLVISIIAIAVMVYTRAQNRKELRRQQELNRIAGDLHDDVGASLSAIRMYSEMLRHKGENEAPQLTPIAQKISENAREIIQNMSDIVWAIKPGMEDFTSLQNRIWNTSLELCNAREISLNFTPTEKLNEWKPAIALRNDIFLVCKEAVNNAVKYSGGTLVSIRLSVEDKLLKVEIADNGQGLSEQPREGNGLKNMLERAQKNKGYFEKKSIPGEGLRLTFVFPVA
jgi:signal transduction histidine kinase/tetratricopeptide (TPR) repeat protein